MFITAQNLRSTESSSTIRSFSTCFFFFRHLNTAKARQKATLERFFARRFPLLLLFVHGYATEKIRKFSFMLENACSFDNKRVIGMLIELFAAVLTIECETHRRRDYCHSEGSSICLHTIRIIK